MRRFAYRLALRLGCVNVDAMLAQITWRQFLEWNAYAALEPFDEEREDLRNAYVVATLANVNRKKGTRVRRPDELKLHFGDAPRRSQTWQEQKAYGRMMYQLMSGRQ